MKKIFCLAAILAVNVILANGDDKVQSLGWIVGKMDTVQLRQFNCTPEVTNNGTNQFITFTTTTTGNDQTTVVCDTIQQYLANATGDATSSCSSNGNQVVVSYVGDYDGTLRIPGDIGLLAIVISVFGSPTLGNVICQLVDSFTTPSGFAYIALNFLASADNYQSLADNAYSYLYSTKLLAGNTDNTVFYKAGSDKALLEIWGTDCLTSAKVKQ